MAQTMGAPLRITPFEGLMHCCYVTAGEVMYAEARVHALHVDDLIVAPETVTERSWSGGENGDGYSDETKRHQKELHIWIRIRQECLERLARFCKMVLDARVDDRFAQIAEGMAGSLIPAFEGVLADLNLTDEQKALIPGAMRKHMLVLETPMMERSGLLDG